MLNKRQRTIFRDRYFNMFAGEKIICKNAIKDAKNNRSEVKARDLLRHRLFRCL